MEFFDKVKGYAYKIYVYDELGDNIFIFRTNNYESVKNIIEKLPGTNIVKVYCFDKNINGFRRIDEFIVENIG